MNNKITIEKINRIILDSTIDVQTIDSKTTLVKLTTKEGFVIIETSSCVDAANYDVEIGKRVCMQHITDKLWAYEGYCLQKDLFYNENGSGDKEPTAKERVESELESLKDKLCKLQNFLHTEPFGKLNAAAQDYLTRQAQIMWDYVCILTCRLSIWEETK